MSSVQCVHCHAMLGRQLPCALPSICLCTTVSIHRDYTFTLYTFWLCAVTSQADLPSGIDAQRASEHIPPKEFHPPQLCTEE